MHFNLEKHSPLDVTNTNGDALVDEEEDEFGELRYDGGVLVQDRQFMVRVPNILQFSSTLFMLWHTLINLPLCLLLIRRLADASARGNTLDMPLKLSPTTASKTPNASSAV